MCPGSARPRGSVAGRGAALVDQDGDLDLGIGGDALAERAVRLRDARLGRRLLALGILLQNTGPLAMNVLATVRAAVTKPPGLPEVDDEPRLAPIEGRLDGLDEVGRPVVREAGQSM